jgi:anti-sigma-K factor RskA
MSKKLNRYQNKVIITHLASHYVLGLLSSRVMARVDKLKSTNVLLFEQIRRWQNELSLFDRHCDVLAPDVETWQEIQKQITVKKNQRSSSKKFIIWVGINIALFGIGGYLLLQAIT